MGIFLSNFKDYLYDSVKVDLKEVSTYNLLNRDEIKFDTGLLNCELNRMTILVSGAGGSIGSEICRQLMKFSVKEIILLGHDEASIYNIYKELKLFETKKIMLSPIIANIQDRDNMFKIMERYKPNIVIHAAAYKHVPFMEENPREAIKNNILGTKNIAESAKQANVSEFIMLSTDKAVDPISVMGATKRVAEMILSGLNNSSSTKFSAVRFGNVLNSSGSVVPLFNDQIKRGMPITITDYRMERFFMTIPEASGLVLQAGSLAKRGEVFVLDMGSPVKILDLAKQIFYLNGVPEDEMKIIETGIRPGEKLSEQLVGTHEYLEKRVYDKISIVKTRDKSLNQINKFIYELMKLPDEQLKKPLIEFANDNI